MVELKKADLNNIPKEERDMIYTACASFTQGKGCDLFFEHLKNLYISSILGLNEVNGSEERGLITDEYFRGGLGMMTFLQDQIREYGQIKV